MEYNEKVNDYFEFVRFCLNDNYKEPESIMKMDWDVCINLVENKPSWAYYSKE